MSRRDAISDRNPFAAPSPEVLDPAVHLFPERLSLLAQDRPDAIALRFRHHGDWLFWRWGDLYAQTQSAGRGLQALGFGASDVLWMGGDLGPHALVLALASWSIGGTVQPLADNLPTGECRYVFLQGRDAVTSRVEALTATTGNAPADLSGGIDVSRRVTLICDQLGLGLRTAEPADGALRLLSYAALVGKQSLPVPPVIRRPADLYWLEESGNDLRKIPALMDFWFRMRVPLTFPGHGDRRARSLLGIARRDSGQAPAMAEAAFAGA